MRVSLWYNEWVIQMQRGTRGDSTLSVRLDFLKKKKKEKSEANKALSSAELGGLCTIFFLNSVINLCLKSLS